MSSLRLSARARERWPELAGIDVKFRGEFAYVTGRLKDGDTQPLMRLQSSGPAPGPLSDLTEKECTTLDLIGEGLTNREIAARMFVAEKTVKNYVSHLLAKLGMSSRTQAAVLSTEIRGRNHAQT